MSLSLLMLPPLLRRIAVKYMGSCVCACVRACMGSMVYGQRVIRGGGDVRVDERKEGGESVPLGRRRCSAREA